MDNVVAKLQQGQPGRLRFLARHMPLDRKIQICDIGARDMRSPAPYQRLLKEGMAELSGFEPEEKAFAELQQKSDDSRRYFQAAVGKPGRSSFFIHQIGSLSSIYRIKQAAADYLGKGFWTKRDIREVELDLVALDQVADFPAIDILKMDAQGAEFDILQGAQERLKKAVVVIPEVRFYQMYEGEPVWADVDRELRSQGFVLHKFVSMKSVTLGSAQRKRLQSGPLASQLLDGDAVYIRNLETPDTVSTEQLTILAYAADAVFHSPDLVAACLTHLARRGIVPETLAKRYIDRLPPDLRGEAPTPNNDETDGQNNSADTTARGD